MKNKIPWVHILIKHAAHTRVCIAFLSLCIVKYGKQVFDRFQIKVFYNSQNSIHARIMYNLTEVHLQV